MLQFDMSFVGLQNASKERRELYRYKKVMITFAFDVTTKDEKKTLQTVLNQVLF